MRIKESPNSQPTDPIASKPDDALIRDALPPQIEQPFQPDDRRRLNLHKFTDIIPNSRTAFKLATAGSVAMAYAIEQIQPGTVEKTIDLALDKPTELLSGIGEQTVYLGRDIALETRDLISESIVDTAQYFPRAIGRFFTAESIRSCVNNECRITLQNDEPPPPQILIGAEALVGTVALVALGIKVSQAIAGPALRITEALTISRAKK